MAVHCPFCYKLLAEIAFVGKCIRCGKDVDIDKRIKV